MSDPGGAAGRGDAGFGACEEEDYVLPSYDGSTKGLCSVAEHMWRRCCSPPADIASALRARCAPDQSVCVVDSYCTTYEFEPDLECGWHACGDDPSGGDGGAGGNGPNCPADRLAEAWAPHLGGGTSPLAPCASDLDCAPGLFCNDRHSNRMFCSP